MNPDLSKDRELVECAAVMRESIDGFAVLTVYEFSTLTPRQYQAWLRMADAARTFFGSGYRLPEATEANAECKGQDRDKVADYDRHFRKMAATRLLTWMHAAFAEPAEKPESVFAALGTCPATSGDHRCLLDAGHKGRHKSALIDWEDEPEESHISLDFATQAAEVERRRLIEAFMLQLAGNPAVMNPLMIEGLKAGNYQHGIANDVRLLANAMAEALGQ